MLAKQVLIKTNLAAWERSLPFQLAIFLRILSTRGWISSLLNFSKWRGNRKFFLL
jgi:hypothetical protein